MSTQRTPIHPTLGNRWQYPKGYEDPPGSSYYIPDQSLSPSSNSLSLSKGLLTTVNQSSVSLPGDDDKDCAMIYGNGSTAVFKGSGRKCSNSIIRTQAAVMASEVHHLKSGKVARKQMKKRHRKKEERINSTCTKVYPKSKVQIPTDTPTRIFQVYVDGGNEGTEPINPAPKSLPPIKLNNRSVNRTSVPYILQVRNKDIEVIPPPIRYDEGIQCRPNGKDLAFILAPRGTVLAYTGLLESQNSCNLCNALLALEEATDKSLVRGIRKDVQMPIPDSKYFTGGTLIGQGQKGVTPINKALSTLNSYHQNVLLKFVKSSEHVFDGVLPTSEIDKVRLAIKLTEAQLFQIPDGKIDKNGKIDDKARYMGGIACGRCAYLSMHKDKDYTFSIVSVHMMKEYKYDDKVVAYFCFPRLGLCVSLRPGDMLFFNANEPHCISSRCDNNDDIFCVSLYLKTHNIGGNNKDIKVTPEMEMLAKEYNNKKK